MTKKKILPRSNLLRAITGIRWGVHPSTTMMVYRGIRSVLDWGCQVFHPLGNKEYTIMCRLQYASLRTAVGLMRTTPTNVILDLCGEYPLGARWRYLQNKYLCRVISRESYGLRPLLISLIDSSIEQSRIMSGLAMRLGSDLFKRIKSAWHVGYLAAPFEVNHHLSLKINTTIGFTIRDSTSVMRSFESLVGRFEEYAVLFTDESRAEIEGAVRVGFAVVIPYLHLTIKIRLSDYSSIY